MSRRLRRTKIVTTLGPATDRDNNLEKIIAAGANVVRFAPALIVSEEEVKTGLDRFELACQHFLAGASS